MTDVDLSLVITRSLLGLPDLELNDFEMSYVTRTLLGTSVTFNRNKTSSAYMDGETTINATRADVMEPIALEVLGENAVECQANANEIAAAFVQDRYELVLTLNGATVTYLCKQADYQLAWVPERVVAGQWLLTLQVPRHPVPLVGVL